MKKLEYYNIIIVILVIIILLLVIKLIIIKKSIKEIYEQIEYILKSDTNNLIAISGFDKEITNLTKRLNEELQKLRKRELFYENGNQELNEIITNVSHDIRTPLTAIKGYTELLEHTSDEEKKLEYLKIIENKANEITVLSEQIFEYSKIIDKSKKINRTKLCINEILEETVANYYNILKQNNINPTIQICREKIYREIDKNILIRIFENIISNAIKYSEGNFCIELNESGKIIFSNKTKLIDKVKVKKMFNRYYTVENAEKSTGLGLSIAKQLVEMSNGKITANYSNEKLTIEIEF